MDLDRVANIAEIAAAVLVVASLVYVGRQLRQNTLSMRLESVHAISAEWNKWYDVMIPDGELINLYHRGVFDFDSLNRTEQMQFIFMTTRIFRTFNELYFSWREGMMEETIWHSWLAQFNDAMKTPGWQETWSRRRHWYGEGFQSVVDGCIAESKNVKPFYDAPESQPASKV